MPYGAGRFTPGVSETDFSFTGQRSLAVAGLMDYQARWYGPAIGRFLSADTIVPGAGSPQAWNRFAYVNGNPLRFSDPSGHYICEDIYACALRLESPKNGTHEEVDNWIWENIPSALSVNLGFSGQAGLSVEQGITPLEFELVFNWRSGELSLLYSPNFYYYFGTPTGIGGDFHFGGGVIYGVSNNQYLLGSDVFGGLTASADVFGRAGISFSGSRSL